MGSAQKLVPELVPEPEQVLLQSAKQPASVPVLVSESAPVLAQVPVPVLGLGLEPEPVPQPEPEARPPRPVRQASPCRDGESR